MEFDQSPLAMQKVDESYSEIHEIPHSPLKKQKVKSDSGSHEISDLKVESDNESHKHLKNETTESDTPWFEFPLTTFTYRSFVFMPKLSSKQDRIETKRYLAELEDSDGFDCTFEPKIIPYGGAIRVQLDNDNEHALIAKQCLELAIEEHNEDNRSNELLKCKAMTKALVQKYGHIRRYYITFEAENQSLQVNTYETMVEYARRGARISVYVFRMKTKKDANAI